MVLNDITDKQLYKLQISYMIIITTLPLLVILIILFYNQILFKISFVQDNYCLSFSLFHPFTRSIVIGTVILIQIAGIVIIIALSYLLYKAYKIQKTVGHDTKKLLRIALGIVVAFGMAWIIYALRPLYDPIAPIVVYSAAALENVVIMAVFFYSNRIIFKLAGGMCFMNCNNSSKKNNSDISVDV